MVSIKTAMYTFFALLAFAGNSVFCRLALSTNEIDAASFTTTRLLSGIVVLAVILKMANLTKSNTSKGSWSASLMLFIYAVTFSYAYITLETGIGALVLFASVQMTMIIASLFSGQKLHYLEWGGVLIAFSGFVYLVLPGLSTPSLTGFLLMAISGIMWGIYTLVGRASNHPLSDTAYNFVYTVPFVLILIAVTFQQATLSWDGILLAVLSGGLASGVGYTIWYMALGGLSITQAGAVQLLVPVIAAIGGVLFADEVLSYRLLISSLMILSGILVVILGGNYAIKRDTRKHNKANSVDA